MRSQRELLLRTQRTRRFNPEGTGFFLLSSASSVVIGITQPNFQAAPSRPRDRTARKWLAGQMPLFQQLADTTCWHCLCPFAEQEVQHDEQAHRSNRSEEHTSELQSRRD